MASCSNDGVRIGPQDQRGEGMVCLNPTAPPVLFQKFEDRWNVVCQVLRSDKPTIETGCVIEGNLLLINARFIECKQSARQASVLFNQFIGVGDQNASIRPISIALDPDRYFFTSEARVNVNRCEIDQALDPPDRNHLGFTIVSLQRSLNLPLIQKIPFSIFNSISYHKQENVYIIHHRDVEHEPYMNDENFPRGVLRRVYPYFIHYSTTEDSDLSSGAVGNGTGQLIALFHEKISSCTEGCPPHSSCYMGVRMDRIVTHLSNMGQKARIEELIKEDLASFNHLVEQNPQQFSTYQELYEKFLSQPSTSSTSSSHSGADSTKIDSIERTLQMIAWIALEKDTHELDEQDLVLLLQENEVVFRDLQSIDLLIFENNRLSFIHPNFREFLAGAYLASFYIDCGSEGSLEKGNKYIGQFKFNPRYALTLKMAVGYLAYRKNNHALETFFDHFDQKPDDLAKGYALDQRAQFFGVCDNPRAIKQYLPFLQGCVEYIERATCQSTLFNLFNRNSKLIHESEIVGVVLSHMADPIKSLKVILTLHQLVSNRHVLPLSLIEALEAMLSNTALKGDVRTHVVAIFGEIVKGGGRISDEAMGALIGMVQDESLDEDVQARAIFAIGMIAKAGCPVSEAAKDAFGEVINDASLLESVMENVFFTLKEIAKSNELMSAWAMDTLVTMINNTTLHKDVRSNAISVLGKIAKADRAQSESAFNSLLRMINSPALSKKLRGSVTAALGKIGNAQGMLSKASISALVKVINDPTCHGYVGANAAIALGKIAKKGWILPEAKDLMNVLVKMIKDTTLDEFVRRKVAGALGGIIINESGVQSEAAMDAVVGITYDTTIDELFRGEGIEILGEIAKEDGVNSQTALDAIVGVMNDSTLDPMVTEIAVDIIGKLGKGGKVIPEAVIFFLVKMLKNTTLNESLRGSAATALGRIFKGGGTIPEEAMSALQDMVEDENFPEDDQAVVVTAIGKIARGRGMMSDRAMLALVEIVKNPALNKYVRGSAAEILKEIAKIVGEKAEGAMGALVGMLRDTTLNGWARGKVAELLGEVVRGGMAIPELVVVALVEMVKNTALDLNCRKKAVFSLREIGRGKEVMSEVAKAALTDLVKDATLNKDVRGNSVEALKDIAKMGRPIAAGAPDILVEIVQNKAVPKDVKVHAIEILKYISKRGGMGSKLAMDALGEMIKGKPLPKYARENAVAALGKVANGWEETSSMEARKVLQEVVCEPTLDAWAKGVVNSILDKIDEGEEAISSHGSMSGFIRESRTKDLVKTIKGGGPVSIKLLRSLEWPRDTLAKMKDTSTRQKIVDLLEELTPHLLIQIIQDTYTCKSVLRICYLTQKAFVIADGQIHISDKQCTVSRPISGVDEDEVITFARNELSMTYMHGSTSALTARGPILPSSSLSVSSRSSRPFRDPSRNLSKRGRRS